MQCVPVSSAVTLYGRCRAFKPDPSYPVKDEALAARLNALGSFVTLDHLDIAENLNNEVSHILAQKGGSVGCQVEMTPCLLSQSCRKSINTKLPETRWSAYLIVAK